MSAGTSVRCLRISPMTKNATTPMATPPTDAISRSMPTDETVTSWASSPRLPTPWATTSPAAASAVRNVTRAVASLSSDSPSRMVVIRRGSPIWRATEVAATASGGATIAPRASASAKEIGSISQATSPTPRAVKSTSPTDRLRMAPRCARTSSSEVDSAAA